MPIRQAPVAEPQSVKSRAALLRIPQHEIARATKTSPVVVSRVFNGISRPTVQFAQRLAEFFGVPEEVLLRPERKPVSPRARAGRRMVGGR